MREAKFLNLAVLNLQAMEVLILGVDARVVKKTPELRQKGVPWLLGHKA